MDLRRAKLSVLKEINPEYLLEGLMLKPQNFGHLMQRDGETLETVTDLGAPKSLQMVTAAVKLKDACSLEEKL